MAQMSDNLIPEIFDSKRVMYECSCRSFKSIQRIYFCRHCHQLRCRDCLSHEVDSQYCQHCLEYIPSIDAKLKKNKCASCFQCPSCMHTLTTRALITQIPNPNDSNQTIHKKIFFLICYYCRWSSRDIGIPDQSVASGNWPELEIPNGKRIDVLFDHYRMLAQREKLEKEKKRISPRSAIILLDKYGITPSLSPKVTATLRAKMARSSSGFSLADLKSPTETNDFDPSVATDDIPELDIDLYYNNSEEEINISKKTTLSQKLMQIESQPCDSTQLYPVSQMLLVKRSLRCKQCDHNLSKPEYNPSSIKFKIQLSAFYHIPELRIKSLPVLKKNEEIRLEMTLQNPTPYVLHITLLPVEEIVNQTAVIVVPNFTIQLSPKDDTVDLDVEQNIHSQYNDDINAISFRKGNKLGFYIRVTPLKSGECKFMLKMKHNFVNTVIQSHNTTTDRQSQLSLIHI